MKKILLMSALLVLGGVLNAYADTWHVTAYSGTYGSGVAATPTADLVVTRTANASGALDSLEIHLASWLLPGWNDGGTNGVGEEISTLVGTWSTDASPQRLPALI